MTAETSVASGSLEVLELAPAFTVPDDEYRRLLGYPRSRELSERAAELALGAREWFGANGKPWLYWREIRLELSAGELLLEGEVFRSVRLRGLLQRSGAERACIIIASAGAGCEEEARRRWLEEKPDEYFFLETYGSAVVEQLMAQASGALCAAAENTGWRAVPHYSPGYPGWEIADQVALFELLRRGARQAWPEPVEVLASGMLRPKKSQLAVVGLRRQSRGEAEPRLGIPCEACSLGDCRFRRRPHRRLRAALPVETSEP